MTDDEIMENLDVGADIHLFFAHLNADSSNRELDIRKSNLGSNWRVSASFRSAFRHSTHLLVRSFEGVVSFHLNTELLPTDLAGFKEVVEILVRKANV